MLHSRVVVLRFIVLSLLITAAPDLILGLRDVSVTVPSAVKKGENAHLICNYDLEGDTLYSVKWYKGRREFYRYTPKENPSMKIFPLTGIFVEPSLSNQSHVVLSTVEPSISDKFSCEISADAPSFHTSIVSGTMEIVELPEQRPFLTGIHSRYRLGDIINGNCTSYYSKPAANLTWTINDIPIPPNQVKTFKHVKNPINNLESSVSGINLIIMHEHFIRSRLKLTCTARIHDIYEQDVEKIIDEDRPRILASGRSLDANLFSIDQQGGGDFDQNELYLTQYKGEGGTGCGIQRFIRGNMKWMAIFIQYRQNMYQNSAVIGGEDGMVGGANSACPAKFCLESGRDSMTEAGKSVMSAIWNRVWAKNGVGLCSQDFRIDEQNVLRSNYMRSLGIKDVVL